MPEKNNNFKFEYDNSGDSLKFEIKTAVYPLDAIYQAAYLFLDKVYVFIDGDPLNEIMVVMKKKEAGDDLEKIAGDFFNELLNQVLRLKVSQANSKIREYIVAKALYNAVPNEVDKLLKEVEEDDWQQDPLGIAQTWDEAHKKTGEQEK